MAAREECPYNSLKNGLERVIIVQDDFSGSSVKHRPNILSFEMLICTPCRDKNFLFKDREMNSRSTRSFHKTVFFILTGFSNCLEDILSLFLG